MKALLALALLALPVSLSAQECRWSGGSFEGDKVDFQARFSVDAGCTEMTFESSGNAGFQAQDVPETFTLTPGEHGWSADIHGVEATLANTGDFVNFIGEGVNLRLQTRRLD